MVSLEPVTLDPADFTTTIDNPYFPLRPGSRWVYRETDTTGARQRVGVTVTKRTKRIANGVTARVVRDVVTQDGRTIEATDDWYAQDSQGNVWYLGEDTAEYRDGRAVNHAGSFEAGVGGAQPGVAMPADPRPGLSYRQEYLAGEAEDTGAVVTVGEEQVEVPYGHFGKRVLMTRDLMPTEPKSRAEVLCPRCRPRAEHAHRRRRRARGADLVPPWRLTGRRRYCCACPATSSCSRPTRARSACMRGRC